MSVSPKTIIQHNLPAQVSHELSAIPGGKYRSPPENHQIPQNPARAQNDQTVQRTPTSQKSSLSIMPEQPLQVGQKRSIETTSPDSLRNHDGLSKRPKTEEPPAKPQSAMLPPRSVPTWAKQSRTNRSLRFDGRKSRQRTQGDRGQNGLKPRPQVAVAATGPVASATSSALGPWEPCFTNIIPYESLTRQISNILFEMVVADDSVTGSAIGEQASDLGQLEIEARVGSVLDKNTNARLSIPVMTETLLAKNYDVGFESRMTEVSPKK